MTTLQNVIVMQTWLFEGTSVHLAYILNEDLHRQKTGIFAQGSW